jgi:hypothetical protein
MYIYLLNSSYQVPTYLYIHKVLSQVLDDGIGLNWIELNLRAAGDIDSDRDRYLEVRVSDKRCVVVRCAFITAVSQRHVWGRIHAPFEERRT